MPNMLDLDTRFSQQPQANIPRSVIPRKSDLKTTMNYGKLYPIYVDEILPADSKKISLGSLVRLSTPLAPAMDSSYLDLYAFFVPNRLVWNHWEEFMGENKDSAWVSDTVYSIPSLDVTDDPQKQEIFNRHFVEESLYDYFGLPTGVEIPGDYHISALPFRAYYLIWNEWFRDQNYQNPVEWNNGDDDSGYVYKLLPVNKLHDEFTSVTPAPQKGESVSLLFNGGLAPVFPGPNPIESNQDDYIETWQKVFNTDWNQQDFLTTKTFFNNGGVLGVDGLSVKINRDGFGDGVDRFIPVNYYASLDNATISTVNQLRNAIVVQQYLETLARGGSRYTEQIRALFGVVSPDARLQRPELLGHIRLNIEMQQVVQTSFSIGDFGAGESLQGSLGSTGAYSKTTGYEFMFDKSFTEHGHLIILACARTELSYQQGVDRMWTRKAVTDFYNPIFANIGNQPILNDRIYLSSDSSRNKEVFGYQEAWSEYRYKPNKITGAFRSNHSQSLDYWHYGQYFDSLPIASGTFMQQSAREIERSLVVQEDTAQLLCNFFFDEVATRPMPVYSIPGLDVL